MCDSLQAGELELQALVRKARSGDQDAHGRWYELEFRVVWRLALGILADSAEAEDVAQETMLHLAKKLDVFDKARSYSAWRTRIVVNRCRDRLRRNGARRAAEERAVAVHLPAQLPDPADEAHASETRAVLEACLSALSPREREVFVLRDLEGGRTAEVALALEITPSSVRSFSTLARRRIRELMRQRVPDLVRELEAEEPQ